MYTLQSGLSLYTENKKILLFKGNTLSSKL